jgi:hypothetical protein
MRPQVLPGLVAMIVLAQTNPQLLRVDVLLHI